jgi:hypothetical protein
MSLATAAAAHRVSGLQSLYLLFKVVVVAVAWFVVFVKPRKETFAH